MPLAFSVYLPRPSVARLKIDDHMMEVQRPQSTKRIAPRGKVTTWKLEPVNTGSEPVMVFGRNMARRMRIMAVPVVVNIMARLETLEAMKLEMRRPTSIKNQYVPAAKPATATA